MPTFEELFGSPKQNKNVSLQDVFGKPEQSSMYESQAFIPSQRTYEDFNQYDYGITSETNQEKNRSINQGTTAEIANGLGRAALNVVPSIIGNIASIADLEDYANSDKEVGNAVTQYMEDLKGDVKEMFPIHGEDQLKTLDYGQSEWWASNFSSLAESAASFAATGAGLGAGVKGLGFLGKIAGASSSVQKAIQGVGGVATAVALNQAEAIPSAMGVYENTFKYQTETLGKSEDEAKQIAADAAAYTININRLNLPLNITSTLAFLRTSPMTRQAIQQAGLKSAGVKIAEEGAQEFGEEIINKVAGDEGNRYGKIGKEYNYDINNTISDVFSAEGLEAGLLGMLGGIAQTGLSEGISQATGKYDEQNKLYQKQQASLKQLEQFSNSPNLKDVVSNITKQASIINDLNDAQAEGDETKVESLKNQLLINQAVNSFDSGTTEQLEEMYSTISKTSVQEGEAKYGKEFKENAIKATSQIRQWEHDWNKFMQTVPDTFNKKELFINKLQQKDISNRINDLKQSESKLVSEIETIKLNSQENVSIPQEVELKAIQDNIGKLQGQLGFVQQKSIKLITPKQEEVKIKTPEQKVKEFKETLVDTSESTKEPVESLETVTKENPNPVFHYTTKNPEDFNFDSFQRGENQISQWGDGLNASSVESETLKRLYGKGKNPIKGEVKDSDFIKIDASKTPNEVYEDLKKQGFKFSTYDPIEIIEKDPLSKNPGASRELFDDFQKSNPSVKGLKISNHSLEEKGTKHKLEPFYVIYDAKSFYGEGSSSKDKKTEDNLDLVEAIKVAHDLFLPEDKKGLKQAKEYIRKEGWAESRAQLKATDRFTRFLEKRGIDPKGFNIVTVENLFKSLGQQEYFEANKEAISAMISSIGIATGTLTPLSFDKNIPPDVDETLEETLSEPSNLKRTTSLNGRYKDIKTNDNGGSLKLTNGVEDKNGDIQFENNDNTPYYDLLHTNDILVGDELELELENPDVEGDLDSLHIRIIDKKSGKLRFYVSSIESVNEDSLDLDEEGLEIEREKIRNIREYFNNNRYGKLQTKVSSAGTGKLEWNGNSKSIAKIPNVHRYLHVKINGDLVGQNSPKWVNNFPNPDWFNEMSEGTVLLTLPEANHSGDYFSRPIPLNVGTFNTSRNPSTELTKIREEVKQELVKYIQTGKVDFKVLNKWIYVQDNNIDPAQLGKKGIQLKNKSIIFNNTPYNAEEAIDSILDQLRVNVSAKLLKDSNSDYATRLINSGVLQSNISYKQVGEDTIFAFQPTFVYDQPTEVAQETKQETPEEIKKETGIDGDFSLDNTSFDLGFSPNILPLSGNEELYKKYDLLNNDGGIKMMSYSAAKKFAASLNQSPYYSFKSAKSISKGKVVYKVVILDKSNTAFDLSLSSREEQRKKEIEDFITSIFPDTKVKDIVYRGSESNIENDKNPYLYFTNSESEAYLYSKVNITKGGNITERNPVPVITNNVKKYINNKYGEKTFESYLLNEEDYFNQISETEYELQLPSWYKKNVFLSKEDENDILALKSLKVNYDKIKIENEDDLDKPQTVNDYSLYKKQYDDSRKKLDKFFNSEELGKITPVFLNVKNPYLGEIVQEDLQDNRDAYKNGHDGAFLMDGDHFLVKNSSEQIHILTKKELEIINQINKKYENTAFDINVEPSTSFNINPNFTLNQEDKIINSFVYEILQGNSKDQLVKYFNKFLAHLESDKSEAAEARKELINNTLTHLDSYLEKAKQLLDSLDFAKDELGFYNEFIDADNSLDQMQEEAAFTEIRVDSIPENVRKFLMYIPQFNNDGTLKRNALGLKTFTPVDTTFNKIAIYLSTVPYDNTKSSFNKMVEMLANHLDPTLKEVAKQLSTVNNEQLQNQFYRAFNQQIIDSRTFLITPRDKGFGVRVARADKSSAFYKIKQEWNINFNNTYINNGVVDTEKGKALNDKFKELASSTNYSEGKLTNQAKDTLLNLLGELGINMSSQGLNSWLQNDSNYKDSKQRKDKEHLKYTLAYVFANVAGESKKSVVSEDEDVITKNNPFENEAKHIESLAYHESSYSKVQGGSSFRHDGKQYSSFVRHMPLETQLNNMKQLFNQSVGAVKNALTSKPVFQHSFYAQQLDKVKFIVERGLRITKKGSKSKNLKDANEKEYEAVRVLAFQKDGYIKTDTLSDKTTNVFFNVPKVNVQLTTTGQLTDDVKKHLHRYFDMEYDRIKIVQQRINTDNKYDGFDSTVGKKGAGEYFLNYDFLNYEVLGDSKDEQFLKKYLYNDLGRLEDLSKYDEELNTAINLAIDNLIEKRVNKITEKLKEDWLNLGIYSKTDKGVVINDIDISYRTKLAKTLTDSNIKPTDPNILLLAIKDYQVNYMTQTIEMLWLYGDPALQSKIKYPKNSNTLTGDELISGIKKTFDNVGKRNASLMAQSEGGNWNSKTYKISFINDIGINSNDVEQYAKDVQQDYQDGEKMTDAQEFTTVEEHLEDRLSFGEISKNLFYLGVMHFDPEVYKSDEFSKKYPDKPEFKELNTQEVNQLNGILQPRKPVQVFNKFTPEGLQVKYYIKTSSIPLIPSVVKGRPLEKVLKSMKSKGVQRIVFNSGVKIGQGGSQTLFTDNEVNPDLFKEGVHTLERSGYGIQLNVPYKEGKDEIRQVTQAMKLLFVDLDDSMTLSNGMTVKEARDKYAEIESKLVQSSTTNLNKDFGAQNGVIIDTSKLSDLLVEEGNDRGYTQNTLAGLKTKDGKFKIPLTYSPNIGQIQPVLTSLINNRIVRQKISGKSYVQTSEILTYKPKGFEELSSDVKSSIVWLAPENKTKSKLDFIKRGDKESAPAEIIAPWFLVKDDKKVPISEFMTDGFLDFTKIDESLLEMHGFRIPNQAHSSMMHFKIVGFLPEGMGDTLIVPSEIAIQMGSDYDVDKLYAYNYEWKDVNGKLTKKDSLVNQLIDIHKAVILSKQMFDVVTKPQGFSDLKNAIQEVSKSLPQDNEWLGSYNPIYQRKEFFDNAAGKTGVGIASNHNTQHALSQQANLFLKDRGIVFKKDDGSYFSEEVERNRVNEYTKGLYTYRQEEDDIDMTERNDSAWRLDKVKTFSYGNTPGKVISNVIAEWQGASVDNAKEKLLGSGGINDYNLSVSLLIARAGFDNEWILNFINQPILKDYYRTIDNLKSVFYDSFESDRRNKAIAYLYSKYGIKTEDYNKFLKEPFEGYTLGEYKDMLTVPDNEKQVNTLKAFLHYENLALGLATLQSATSVDVKGLPKNYVETVELAKKQGMLDKLPVGNTYKMWDTVVGGFLGIPQYTTDLYSEIFDYSTEAYNNVLTTLQYLQKSDGFTTEQLNKIYNNLYSFIYTLPSIQESVADGKNVEEYKKSLVLGDNTLSDRVQELKLKYPDNLLLSRISRVLDNENQVKRVQLDSTFSKTESYDKEVTASWLDMIRNNQSDLELKQLGLDLAAYAMYFNNEPYGVSNFMKYVPIEYFEAIGFGEKLQDIHYQLSDKDFLNNFTQQYYQHNVEDAKSATSIEQVSNEGGIVTLDKDNAGSLALAKKADNSLEIEYSPYVKIYNKKTSNYDLYKLVDDRELLTYQKIDQLGETGFNEYDFSKENQTSLLNTNVAEVPNVQPKLVGSLKKPKFIYKDYFKLGSSDISNPKDLLRNVLEQTTLSDNNVFSILAEQFLNMETNYIVELASITNKLVLAQTDSTRKVMTFDVSKFKDRTPYEIQRTILHEFVHAFTLGKINDPEFKQTKEYKKLESVWNKWKDSLSKEELVEAEDFKKRYEDYTKVDPITGQKIGNPLAFQGLQNSELKKSKYYAYVKLDEFVTHAMTDQEFQSKLDSISGTSEGLWRDFVNAIKDLIKSVVGNSLLDESIEATIGVINAKKKVSVTVSQDLGLTIGDLMKEMTSEQRAKFRELRESGIFTTKC